MVYTQGMETDADQTTTATATHIRTLSGFRGDARLYKLSEPLDGASFVIVSAVVAYSGPETYIFPATEEGEISDYGEMDGSFRGGLDHEMALSMAGYEVADV